MIWNKLKSMVNKLIELISEGYRRQYVLDLYSAGVIDAEEMLERTE